ncbi:exodeoxyribonuclease V subunit beta [Marinobacterium jannaschii]|uniref:exodeoxyribonuclease V subunit beta n=1 Tax=Marinobacterium jannaschii TaxID=64970 RepID=UPI000489D55B|nr:exodeoxyribonuclease V subunit beta [Marinobacterium jannaschii]
MTKPLPLDPITFPLHGLRLIEASAGTGKTYTITALYLRLLLGHGAEAGRPLPGPDQILVVTFTEAATEELRDRIRNRIGEARLAFLLGASNDPLLQRLLDDTEDHPAAARLLEQAAQQMDEAAIFTIHGFCQRMLRRHAFESGALFESELTQDDQPLVRNAVLDFWRSQIYTMSPALADAVLNQWKTPDALLADIRSWLSTHELRLQPDLSGLDLEHSFQLRQQEIDQFRQTWLQNSDDLEALIRDSGVNKSSYRKDFVPKWIAQIAAWVSSEQAEPSKEVAKQLQRFSQETLISKTKKGAPPEHALFRQIDRLADSEVPLRQAMLARAMAEVKLRLQQHKQQHNLLTFDDLLSGLDSAIQREGGERLAEAIRQQFPVAMIDEFQDTDPLQYRIFSTLYGDRDDAALIMIGDPKQAIYAFRGADIFTYITARRQVGTPYTLDTNWRSTGQMVASVNRLFESAQSPFIYDQDILFQPVKAAGKSDKTPLTLEGKKLSAMALWHQPGEPLSRTDYRRCFARATAVEIDRLLSSDCRIGERCLQAGDIAVLVRDRYEADAVRSALAQFERPCVYLSNRESVFASQEAADFYLILQAVQEPGRERALRAALATELLQLDVEALDRLNHDERTWEATVAEFSDYQQSWHRHGVLPMLHRLLQRRNLAEQLLAMPGGERRLTDLLHIAELLQQASTEVEGHAGLLRWFADHIMAPNGGSEEQLLRLESDRNLVTMVTVHKSKGLEYPVVFLPFAADLRQARNAFYHDDDGQAILDLDEEDEAMGLADRERLAEEIRLLYVALTRSVYRCYLGLSHLKIGNSKKSVLDQGALGYLLLGDGAELDDKLALLQQSDCGIDLMSPPQDVAQVDMFGDQGHQDAAEQTLQARQFTAQVPRGWRITSYSALARHGGQAVVELPGLDLEVIEERDQHVTEEHSIFTFPKGARAGTFLHSLFEEIDFPQARGAELQAQIAESLEVEGYPEHWLGVLDQLVADVLDTELAPGLALRNLSAEDKQVEMEFMLPVEGLNATALNKLISRYDPLSAQAQGLHFDAVKGMLKGFIDLVFRYEGRYYILDYKSNHLGDQPELYQADALANAMTGHRYDLQYQLYALALHRLLASRLPDYDYERHFGGVYYLFLRGMKTGSDSGIFFNRPPHALVEALDQMFREAG